MWDDDENIQPIRRGRQQQVEEESEGDDVNKSGEESELVDSVADLSSK